MDLGLGLDPTTQVFTAWIQICAYTAVMDPGMCLHCGCGSRYVLTLRLCFPVATSVL